MDSNVPGPSASKPPRIGCDSDGEDSPMDHESIDLPVFMELQMDSNVPGPSRPKRPRIGSGSGGEGSSMDVESIDPPQKDNLEKKKFFENKATLNQMLERVVKPKLDTLFKEAYKKVTGADWRSTENCGNSFLTAIKFGKCKPFNGEQLVKINCGQMQGWDITLLAAAISELERPHLSAASGRSLSKDVWDAIKALKTLRNAVVHNNALPEDFGSEAFEIKLATLKQNAKILGCDDEEFEEALMRTTMQPRIFICEKPKKTFCGREEATDLCMEAVRRAQGNESRNDRTVVIFGFGGMGKSQLAKFLCQRLWLDKKTDKELRFNIIFWILADTKESIQKDLKRLAFELDIQDKLSRSDNMTPDDVDMIYEHLGRFYEQKVLLIFDNAECLKAEKGMFGLETYMGPESNSKSPVFLVTSRVSWWPSILQQNNVKIDELQPHYRCDCLLDYMGICKEDRQVKEMKALKKAIDSLLELTGGHPLGLALCGSTLKQSAQGIGANLTNSTLIVKEYTRLLLESKFMPTESGEGQYKAQVLGMCQVSMGKIMEDNPELRAKDLLGIIAHLCPDKLTLGLVKALHNDERYEHLYALNVKWDDLPTDMNKAINIFRRYSLIELRTVRMFKEAEPLQTLRIHRLVQECFRDLTQRNQPSSNGPLGKMIRFSDHNKLPDEHISFLLRVYAYDPSKRNTLDAESFLKLYSRIQMRHGIAGEVYEALARFPENTEEYFVAKLLHLPGSERNFREVENIIRNLSCKSYQRKGWVLKACCDIIDNWIYIIEKIDDFESKEHEMKMLAEVCGWVLQGYKDYETIPSHETRIIQVLLFFIIGGGKMDHEVVSKLFSSKSLHDFWYTYNWKVFSMKGAPCWFKEFEDRVRKEWLSGLFPSSQPNLFTRSMQPLDKHFLRLNLDLEWCKEFFYLLEAAALVPDLRDQLLKESDKLPCPLWRITEWIFAQAPAINSIWKCHVSPLPTILRVWYKIFSEDMTLYASYGDMLKQKALDWSRTQEVHDQDQRELFLKRYREILKMKVIQFPKPGRNDWVESVLGPTLSRAIGFGADEPVKLYTSVSVQGLGNTVRTVADNDALKIALIGFVRAYTKTLFE